MPNGGDIILRGSQPNPKDINLTPQDGTQTIIKSGGFVSASAASALRRMEYGLASSMAFDAAMRASRSVELSKAGGAVSDDGVLNAPDRAVAQESGTLALEAELRGAAVLQRMWRGLIESSGALLGADSVVVNKSGGFFLDSAFGGSSEAAITKYNALISEGSVDDWAVYFNKSGTFEVGTYLSGAAARPAPPRTEYGPWSPDNTSDFVVKFNRQKKGALSLTASLGGRKEIHDPNGRFSTLETKATLSGALEVYDLRPIWELERRQRNQKALLLADVL